MVALLVLSLMFKFTPSGLGCCCGRQQPGPVCITTAPVETARTLCQPCAPAFCLSLTTGGGSDVTSNPCHALHGVQFQVPHYWCNHFSNYPGGSGSLPVSLWQKFSGLSGTENIVATLPDHPGAGGLAAVRLYVEVIRGCFCSDAPGIPTAMYTWEMLVWYDVFVNNGTSMDVICRHPIWANGAFGFVHRDLGDVSSTAIMIPPISSATWEYNIIAHGVDSKCWKCLTPDFGQSPTGWTLTAGACPGAQLSTQRHRSVRVPRLGEPVKLWMPPTLSGGPGTELKKILVELQVDDESCLACDDRARTMDLQGPGWCRDNRLLIATWLWEEAKARVKEFEFDDKPEDFLKLVDEAIRRAEEKVMA